MKKGLLVVVGILSAITASAQESQEVYSFLRLPVSAHAAALGGDNITITDDDPTFIFHNPALISGVSDKSLNLNFMTYMEGAKTASASFVKAVRERATWGLSAQYMDYGSMKEVTAENIDQGTFSARDVALGGSFAYLLGNRFSGETVALLDALGDSDRVAIVVPSFPALKRTNVGGYILVDGKPLQKSLAGLEDLFPAETGRVADLFTEKFQYKAEALHLKEYLKGTENLANTIKKMAKKGVRAIVLDCTSQEDINMIADAVLLSGIKFIAVDPGPFTATLARKVMRPKNVAKEASETKIFGIVGGVNPLISAQVEQLRLEEKVLIVMVRNLELLEDLQRRNAEINRVVDEIVTKYNSFTIAFAVSDNMEINNQLVPEYQEMLLKTNRTQTEAIDIIATAYGQIVSKVLERRPDIKALYTKGAEFTVATCRELKSIGLKILGQVLPLTCYGELIDGDYAGLKCVTSASSATDTNTITDSIQYLKRKLTI